MHIYVVTCLANGKVYVGQTSHKSLRRYFLQKLSDDALKGHPNKKVPLYNAIRKYGREAFVVEEMFCPTSKRQMDMLEKSLIRILNARNRNVGYNVTAGGEGMLGVKKSPAECKRLSERMKGKRYALGVKRSDEQKAGMRERMRGNKYGCRKPSSPKHIAALAANSFANKTPEEFAAIKKLANESRRKNGWIITEETKKKISASTKGKPKSETTKKRMRVAFLDRTTHEERCALSRLANEKRWAKVRELTGPIKESS